MCVGFEKIWPTLICKRKKNNLFLLKVGGCSIYVYMRLSRTSWEMLWTVLRIKFAISHGRWAKPNVLVPFFILLSVRLDQQIAPWGEKSPIFLENFRGKSDLDHHVVVIDSRRCRQILVVIKISQMNILPPRQSNPINLPLKFLAVEVKNVHFLNLWSFIRCWKNGVLKFCICEYDGLKVNQQRSLKLWR